MNEKRVDLHQLADLDLHFLREYIEFGDLFICIFLFLRQYSIVEARDIDIFYCIQGSASRPCHSQNAIIYW